MAYTWGYLKENTLSKLHLEEEEANQLGFLSRFPYAANEAMTQICSGIKPKQASFEFEVVDMKEAWARLTKKHGVYLNTDYIEEDVDEDSDDYERKEAFWKEWNTLHFTNVPIEFPEDFVVFDDDVAEYKAPPIHVGHFVVEEPRFEEVGDDILEYDGDNHVICKRIGHYKIPYSARWFFFTKELQNSDIITAPADVLDALPSYMASQCLKIDDEQKSAIFRNEYEMFLARINDTSFKRQRTFTIGGNW